MVPNSAFFLTPSLSAPHSLSDLPNCVVFLTRPLFSSLSFHTDTLLFISSVAGQDPRLTWISRLAGEVLAYYFDNASMTSMTAVKILVQTRESIKSGGFNPECHSACPTLAASEVSSVVKL